MEKFDYKNLTPEICAEIQACKNTEELKAYFASKNITVPDCKLEDIKSLADSLCELKPEDIEAVSRGCCDENDDGCNKYVLLP